MIARIVFVELSVLWVSSIFLTPLAVIQALSGHWLGLNAYVRAAAWGGVFLFAGIFLFSVLS